MQRVAMLSVHTSPLAQPGTGDGGGMNVYVRALGSALAAPGVAVDVLTRAEHPEQPPVVDVEPGFRCCTCPRARARPCRCASSPTSSASSPTRRTGCSSSSGTYDVLHANYWVSGAVGHRLKHELDLPLVTTFHTLDRVKAEVGLADDVPLRPRVEAEVVRCADLVVASTHEEQDQLVRHYGADPDAHRDHHARASTTRCSSPATAPRRAVTSPLHRRPDRALRRPPATAEGRRPRGACARRARRAPGRRS